MAIFSDSQPGEASTSGRPPTIRQMDKRQLAKGQWQEVASRLRAEHRPDAFRIYRYALDDLRLLKALEEAGMEGRVVVTDSVKDADVVLAAAKKRTSKKVDTTEAEAAARNAGVPFVRLQALSALRVMEAIAPLMGIPVPEHLVAQSRSSNPYLPPKDPALVEVLQLLQQLPSTQQQAHAAAHSAISAASHERLGAPPDLDWLDVDYPGEAPVMKGDRVGKKYFLIRAVKPGSKKAKKSLQKKLAEQNAPW